ncbi:sigma-54 dependent transcriptional regulator [Weeksellaceae bacterium KMM 9713]|uniref:Sigma-54 dependent transcriptional regulator n=1 Tax=Profundicola chukchiensis TaxID=2961959 RepID=A0A9X4N0A0_9FLAO|nr:sigma-54 dependent transcriptional regulator [Profundicola chukchiensis]MDG4945896.1 sigma-54 dependent transcriptional regulator [Profundicola chukchiensis]MDG4951246.1 sigma-54 dependent transcriptional regulator [Profundicola chukchiensis]
MPNILIIEDEPAIRNVLRDILTDEDKTFKVEEAGDGEEGLELIKKKDYDLVICDIKMPKKDGLEVLQLALNINPDLPFLMISGHGDIETAVDCIKKGAYDYISKPPDLNRLLNSVRIALDRKSLIKQNRTLKDENKALKRKVSEKYEMIGNSDALNEIREMINKVASTEARVLITGPNGTGKELVAHHIHEKSDRNKMPMIEVNCAAIPSELIESELFGHMKGSFTGAHKDKAGKFELANKGTIFLDEIGDMSLSAQAKVLRALQEGKITRVGGDKEINVDVRVLAATNKDLAKEIEEGNFREDLYHRLAVILIKVPGLDERKEDIESLVEYFAEKIAIGHGEAKKEFSKDAIEALKAQSWTGNIRELRNVVERLIILGENPVTKKDVASFVIK